MARYKPVVRDGIFLPVILSEQIQPGTFEFALDHLADHELDLSALDEELQREARVTRDFIAKAQELKSNVTDPDPDPDSAKMAVKPRKFLRPDMKDTTDAVRMDPRFQYSTTLSAFGDGVKTQSR